jgi:hypothetical protein
MNPNSGENAHFEQAQPPPENYEDGASGAVEAQPAHVESAPSKQTQPPLTAQPPQGMPPPVTMPRTDDATSTPATNTVSPSSDNDRIERQWVDRAKTVAAETRDDPYAQKNAMTKVKSDYIKSRFNKSLPPASGVS